MLVAFFAVEIFLFVCPFNKMLSLIAVLSFYYANITSTSSPEFIKDYIVVESLIAGVDPQVTIGVAKAESGFNTEAVGDHGTSFGVWQIHNPKQKGLTVEQCKDIIFSTTWSLNTMIKDGGCRQWSTCPKYSQPGAFLGTTGQDSS